MWVALKGHREEVELLVTKGASKTLTDRFGINILHSACLGGDVDVVNYVLSHDMADIDSRAQCKRTPMMLAAENGHKEVVELLMGEGADMSLVDKHHDNILYCACRRGHVEVVQYILSQGKVGISSRGSKKKRTPVMMAAAKEHKDVVEFLVEHGSDLSLVNAGGSSTLHLASWRGHLEVVKYIVSKYKLNINSRGWKKKTPVIVAAAKGHKDVGGHLEVVKYIVSQNKVDINSRGSKKKTPVMVAAANGHKKLVEFLIRKGADAIGFKR
ncbi:ankyrin repeat domain-containing protein 50-like [Haliotis rubra]|uniref:ankyrin repeat domain-containing protein 50-like n=1 Tax=Haliotis rubra TaxID=36100 RepID=UPI001EE5AE77|nr:ankyrin repeat domain-containing protein 50-like [Haliotis rubra]